VTVSARDLATRLLDKAARRADAAEVIVQQSEQRSVRFQDNALKSVTTRALRGVGLRVIRQGRIGFSSTNDPAAFDTLIEQALHSASLGQEAKFEFPRNSDAPEVRLHDPAVTGLAMERAIAIMRQGIDGVLAAYPDAHCSGGISRSLGVTILCNSSGLFHEEESTSYDMGLSAFLVRGESFLWIDEEVGSCRLDEDIARLARMVVQKARLSEREVHPTAEKMPVVFTPRALDVLLATLEANVNGKTVQKGASVLAERLGERVLDERVTILDDPLVDFASGSYAVDAEGLPARTKPLFEKGVLRTFIYDLQTAGMCGVQPTANAQRGYSSQPHPGPGNIRLLPGQVPYREIISGISRGLIVDQLLGAGQSNVLQGAFAVNVELGFLVEKGEIVGRVKDTMLAGNAFDAFNNIRAISAETEWHGDTELPYVCFESLSVAGRGT